MDEEVDFYSLLGLDITASAKSIAKNYRLKALTCHPDKVGPDDTEAAALFLALTKAYDILSDPAKRAEYNVKHQAKLERLRKKEAMNTHSRKLRDDLEARERAAKRTRTVDAEVEAATKEEIERLREAGLAKLREHERALAQKAQQLVNIHTSSNGGNNERKIQELDSTLMVKWNLSIIQPDEAELTRVFEMYGPIEHVFLPSKKWKAARTAIVAFKNVRSAVLATMDLSLAFRYEITWASGQEPPEAALIRSAQQAQEDAVKAAKSYQQSTPISSTPAFAAGAFNSASKTTNGTSQQSNSKKMDDFEDMILQQMMSGKK